MERVYQLSEQELLKVKNLIGNMGEIYDDISEELFLRNYKMNYKNSLSA